ncbi:MAG: DNA-protecting protein DprA [Coriobacteriia bacterium]|nr:DNA-protecting protein DprA [Coriobacteriia bacterium]
MNQCPSWVPDSVRRFELRLGEEGYPSSLQGTPNAPLVLRGLGNPDVLNRPCVAIVGARKATPYGLRAASEFGRWAAQAGYTVISGAAMGCDQAAHRAALDALGVTVAVLGCGADVVYPRAVGPLLTEIVARGAVVSEFDWSYPPSKWTFRARNRIIAGLSGALLVTEAGLPSGTFSTADFALACGRDVMAVPGSIYAPECRGANRLIRQGATPVTDVSEFAEAIGYATFTAPPAEGIGTRHAGTEERDEVLAALLASPTRPDDLARDLQLDIVTVARRIGRLQAEGHVGKYPDGRYGPC